jgi:hypothetical protein
VALGAPTINEILAEPSRAHFRQLALEVDRLDDKLIATRLHSVLQKLESWPKELRTGEVRHGRWSSKGEEEAKHGPVARWLWELFDGVFNPRLALLEEASLSSELEYLRGDIEDGKSWGKQTQESLALAVARHLDPDFAYPRALAGRDEDRTPDAETTVERFGDEKTGFVHTEYTIEHAADHTSGHRYAPYGLAADARVEVDIFTRSRSLTHKLWMRGPTPAVLDLALAWGELWSGGPVLLDSESIAEIAARRRDTITPASPIEIGDSRS